MQLVTKKHVDIHMLGYDRPYTERRDISGRDGVKDILLLKARLLSQTGDNEVGKFDILEQSVVTLPSGEVLRGDARVLQTVVFGDVRPIPDQPYPVIIADLGPPSKADSLSEAFRLSNAQKVHGIYQRMRAEGYTHLVSGVVGGVVWLNPKDSRVRVYGRDGRQQWPLSFQAPGADPSFKR